MRTLNLMFVALFLFAATGCTSTDVAAGSPSASTTAESRCAVPRTVVVGIDRSGSYALVSDGIAQVARILDRTACPDDIWYLRWIEADSYGPAAAITTITFNPVPPQPTKPANPLARRAHLEALQAWGRHVAVFRAERTKAAKAIEALRRAGVAGGTDVVGFLMKSDELLVSAPAHAQRVVLMTTDLQHNVDRDGAFDLRGAHVLLLVFQADDPVTAQQLRVYWDERLSSSGAASVRFRDPMETADTVLDAPAASPAH